MLINNVKMILIGLRPMKRDSLTTKLEMVQVRKVHQCNNNNLIRIRSSVQHPRLPQSITMVIVIPIMQTVLEI